MSPERRVGLALPSTHEAIVGLWAHEGVHYQGNWDEEDANYWQQECGYILEGRPSAKAVTSVGGFD